MHRLGSRRYGPDGSGPQAFAIPGPFGYDSNNCPGEIPGPSIALRFLGLFDGWLRKAKSVACAASIQTLRKAGLADAVGDEG